MNAISPLSNFSNSPVVIVGADARLFESDGATLVLVKDVRNIFEEDGSRTTCLYSAASLLLRILSAANHKLPVALQRLRRIAARVGMTLTSKAVTLNDCAEPEPGLLVARHAMWRFTYPSAERFGWQGNHRRKGEDISRNGVKPGNGTRRVRSIPRWALLRRRLF